MKSCLLLFLPERMSVCRAAQGFRAIRVKFTWRLSTWPDNVYVPVTFGFFDFPALQEIRRKRRASEASLHVRCSQSAVKTCVQDSLAVPRPRSPLGSRYACGQRELEVWSSFVKSFKLGHLTSSCRDRASGGSSI